MFNSKSRNQEAFHVLSCSPETLTAVERGQAGLLEGQRPGGERTHYLSQGQPGAAGSQTTQ